MDALLSREGAKIRGKREVADTEQREITVVRVAAAAAEAEKHFTAAVTAVGLFPGLQEETRGQVLTLGIFETGENRGGHRRQVG
jgi:DNA-binding IclR family transcriptional regulator